MIDEHDRRMLARLKCDGCSGRELMRVWRSLSGPPPPPTLEQRIAWAEAQLAKEREKMEACERMVANLPPDRANHFRRFRRSFLRSAERELQGLLDNLSPDD
jgi:hypothetical protein